MQDFRNKNIQSFLDKLFEGSLEKWRDWSNHNIHYPYTEYLVGGLYQKKHSLKETKGNQDNTKMNFSVTLSASEIAACSARKPGYDHIYVTNDIYITQKRIEDYLADSRESRMRLEKNPPKVEPLSPRTATKIKKMMAEELNRPLEIEDYSHTLTKEECIIVPVTVLESTSDKKKKNRTKSTSKDNTV